MFIQWLRKEKRAAQLYTLIAFVVMSLVFLVVTYLLQVNEDANVRSRIEIIERDLVELEKTTMEDKLNRRAADILFVTDMLKLSDTMLGDYKWIEEPWIAFANRYKVFDQIRYLDNAGQEQIRINYSPQGAYAVDESELQDKSTHTYFSTGRLMSNGKIYISEMDLNVENGKIEIPFRPMLRLSTPLHQGNWRDGVVVLNYNADDMLQDVRDIAKDRESEISLLDRDGYWLFNNLYPEKEWGFMFESRKDESFANEHPQAWDIISGSRGYGQVSTEAGTFFYTSLSTEKAVLAKNYDVLVFSDAGVFHIVSFIPAASTYGQRFSQTMLQTIGRVLGKYWSAYLLISGIAFALAAVIAVSRAQNKEILYYSEFDALTGVYNRRAGYHKLEELRKQTVDRGYEIAVCFIDVNDLKVVNDTLGHDRGDELIKTIATVIQDSVRGNDFIARFGGDEFLIVFDRLSMTDAESVWQRINRKFEEINTQEQRPYCVSVSHGIGVFMSNEDISVDDIITRADEKMYEEKHEIKKNLTVIRTPKP